MINPYEASPAASELGESKGEMRGRYGCSGTLTLLLGAVAIGGSLDSSGPLDSVFAFGVCWIIAAACYWSGRPNGATIAVVVGIVVFFATIAWTSG